MEPTNDGRVKIKSNLAGKLLDPGMATENGTVLQIWADVNGDNQFWTIDEVTRKPKTSVKATTVKAKAAAEKAATEVVKATKPAAEKAVKAAKPAVEKTVEAAKPVVEKAVKAAEPVVEKTVEAVKPAAEKAVEAAKPVVEKAVKAAEPVVEKTVETVKPAAEKLFSRQDCRCQGQHPQGRQGQAPQVICFELFPCNFCAVTRKPRPVRMQFLTGGVIFVCG